MKKIIITLLLLPFIAYCDEFIWDTPEAHIDSGLIIHGQDTISIKVGAYGFNSGRFETSVQFAHQDSTVDLNTEICDGLPQVKFYKDYFIVSYTYYLTNPHGLSFTRINEIKYTWDPKEKKLNRLQFHERSLVDIN